MTRNSLPRKSEKSVRKALREPLVVPEHLGGPPRGTGGDIPHALPLESVGGHWASGPTQGFSDTNALVAWLGEGLTVYPGPGPGPPLT